MRILSLLILVVLLFLIKQKTDSPHGSSLKISCSVCHSSNGWQLDKEIYSFNHSKTKLPLVGQHLEINCKLCHTTLVFSDAPEDCSECHIDIHQSTVGSECYRCHTPVSWLVNNIIEIHQTSRFPLIGAHRTADCNQCHKSESMTRFDIAGINCIDCHQQDYLSTTNPNHIQSGISEDCLFCHQMNTFQWSENTFNHSFFPLVLGHSVAKCADCHKTTNYSDQSSDCYFCHQQDYLATTNPNHSSSGFSTNCGDCHSINPEWNPAAFDHSSFPLSLGHSTPNCADCHKAGNYTGTTTDCYDCHQQDYLETTDPDHAETGFPIDCQACHTTNPGWGPAIFDHSSFPLTLGHSTPACADCHKAGNYTGTTTDCYDCHQQDYLATTDPDHVSTGFPIDCQMCHSTNPGWEPATFDHSSFPLTLGHSTPACADCHTTGNYTGLTTDCYDCHQEDFNNSLNPDHEILNFSITCTQCHNTNPDWQPASFTQHDSQFFPIYSGNHRNEWDSCTDCHENPANYNQFSCIICHEHNKTEMDDKHKEEGDYLYDSESCYSCHPRGNAE